MACLTEDLAKLHDIHEQITLLDDMVDSETSTYEITKDGRYKFSQAQLYLWMVSVALTYYVFQCFFGSFCIKCI